MVRRFHTARVGAALLLLAGFIVGEAGPASAADDGSVSADVVAGVVEDAAPDADVVAGVQDAGGAVTASSESSITVVPASGAGDVVTTGETGLPVTIGLPSVVDDAQGVLASDGSIVYVDPQGKTDVVVQPLDDGLRIETVMNSPTSPTAYTYSLGEGVVPSLNADGSLELLATFDGIVVVVGYIPIPWATDASGAAVPTKFVVNGNDLIQVVSHTGTGVTYPVVADPWFQHDCGTITCTVRLDRAQTRNARDAGWLIAAAGGICAAFSGGTLLIVCAAAIAPAAVVIAVAAGRYYEAGNCLGIRFSRAGGIGWPVQVTRYTYNCR